MTKSNELEALLPFQDAAANRLYRQLLTGA